MRHVCVLAVVALVVGGCATYSLVEPRLVTIAGAYMVDPQIPWSAAREGAWEVWTVDGPSLQSIQFLKGLEDGEPLFRPRGDEKRPNFRKTMTASEIMELVVDSFSAVGAQKIRAMNLRPAAFGTAQGFRFELAYLTATGLEKQAMVAGAVLSHRLYLIIYSGAREHYYPKYREHAERIIQSVRLKRE